MVDYSKWDELAASIGEDYEKEDEEGKRQWLSKWEIDNAQLQREWLGNDKAAEQQAPDARATWNAGGGEGSLRSQLGLRDDLETVESTDRRGQGIDGRALGVGIEPRNVDAEDAEAPGLRWLCRCDSSDQTEA